jgi:hypothetical protein
MEDIPDP